MRRVAAVPILAVLVSLGLGLGSGLASGLRSEDLLTQTLRQRAEQQVAQTARPAVKPPATARPASSGTALPRPARAAPTEAQLAAVQVLRVVRPGTVVEGTPAELNVSITLRYGPARPSAVLLLMPGYLGGANSFDRLARQIVALAPTVAVWIAERRENLLEPQAQIAGASLGELGQIAAQGLPPLAPDKVAYMKDWGLDLTLRDWRVAVQEARTLTPNVYLGGHSLGAALSGLYASYDFGTPGGSDQRGYDDVRGLVLLDGYPGLLSGNAVTPREYNEGASNMIGPLPGLNTLKNAPYVDTFFYGPRLASRAAAQARLAALAPRALAPTGGFAAWPATNLAAAMLTISQRYAQIPFISVTTGRATNVREEPSLLPRLIGGTDTQRITGPENPARPIDWQSDAQTLTDPGDFVRRFWTAQSDATEWYFPQRLVLDVAAARTDTRGTPYENRLRVWHSAAVTLPVLGIAAERGVARESDFQTYARSHQNNLTTHVLPGAAHLDVTFAKSDQVARWVAEWLSGVQR